MITIAGMEIPEAYFSHPLFYLYIWFFGACLGSFLNVCIYRIPEELSVVSPGSRCPKCLMPIRWFDNIPVLSWIALGGRCRSCKTGISPRYMVVEIITGVLFLLVYREYGLTWLTPIYWLFIFGLILGTFVDFDHMILPDRVTLGGMAIGLPLCVVFPEMHGETEWWPSLKAGLIGLAVGWGILYSVMVLGTLAFKKDAMGFGDVKLMGAVGAFLGWDGALFTIMFSSLLGSVIGVSLILTKGKVLGSRIPYGPYLAMAAVVWLFPGKSWWDWYVSYVQPATRAL
jgi:leader peptidase (prepilin peptidase) / N-methyltransferase